MTPEDFFVGADFLGHRTLDRDLLDHLRSGENVDGSDVEVGVALLRLAHDELEAYGTGGTSMSEEDIRLILRTCRILLERTGIDLDLPFSDFQTFYSFWIKNGAYGIWQARRDILNDLFDPVHLELARREDNELVSTLAFAYHKSPGYRLVSCGQRDQRASAPLCSRS